MTLDEAVRLIQRHERARQGRLRARFMREIRQQEEVEKSSGAVTKLDDPAAATLLLQKVTRLFLDLTPSLPSSQVCNGDRNL